MQSETKGSILGGALLVAGSCIGGGMLGLPVMTAACGFLPALVVFFICWLFMASTGLLLAEVCLWMGEETNIISMAERTLGRWGKAFSWVLYLFLFYTLTLSYVTECGNLVAKLFDDRIPEWIGTSIFLLFFAPFIWLGARYVERLNRPFMYGLGISFLIFLWFGVQYVDPERLEHRNWWLMCTVLPLSFTSFAYQGIVPTLTQYLGSDPWRVRRAILIGSSLPFFCYVLWEGLILGIVPLQGEGGLAQTLQQGGTAIYPLKQAVGDPTVILVGEFFAFFALVTSFLGVTLGLRDFLADGLGVEKTAKGRFFLCLLIFIPPLIVSKINPHIFLAALGYAGAIGCALLLGLLPIMMAAVVRYREKAEIPGRLPGGAALLSTLLIVVFIELLCQLGNQLGWFTAVIGL